MLTAVIVVGYGGYTAWHAITGGGDSGGSGTAATDYPSIVNRDIFFAGQALGAGTGVHLMGDLVAFRDTANRVIFTIGLDRSQLAKLAGTATGPQREVITSTEQSLGALQDALVDWRDAVYNLRLAAVDDAHAAVDDALAQLRGDLERWDGLPAG